ncbi:STAS domain-containing protein [Streptomyces sp. H34-S4]|uniref:STAS domain-containing protein n=1 Tax=Streptomyces sp. H34-S4 TaxID=2996463 RepID=UPI00226F6A3F|nr:STAS domain-containing protein [Streptomyces sp. H34-S4]MCY0937553.1 STAS domain-containing protein [Streptomyces sp. H34-S4]
MTTTATTPILPHTTQPESGSADTGQPAIVVHCWTSGDTLTVYLAGEIDCASEATLRVMLTAATAHGYTRLIVDASRITFCDSALLRALEEWPSDGRSVCLENPSRATRRLLTASAGRLPTHPHQRASTQTQIPPTAEAAGEARA